MSACATISAKDPEDQRLRRRAHSSPAASLRHAVARLTDCEEWIFECATLTDMEAAVSLSNPRVPVPPLIRLFTTYVPYPHMAANGHDVPGATAQDIVSAASPPPPPTVRSEEAIAPIARAMKTADVEYMKSQLVASTSQIQLLNRTNEHSLGMYSILEEENRTLRLGNRRLLEENEDLRERIVKRDNEIDEQLHMICELQQQLRSLNDWALKHCARD